MSTWKTVAAVIVAQMALASMAYAACDETQPDTSRYTLNGGEVYDSKTNLTWQRCSVGQSWGQNKCNGTIKEMTWDQAMKAGGSSKSGWRLPTSEELKSLLQSPCGMSPGDKQIFPNVDVLYPMFWSSSTTEPTLAWLVGVGNDSTFNGYRTAPNAVRLVRTGK